MSSPVDIGVCEYHKSNKKGVCEHCGGCRCCDPPTDCSLKRNHIGYKNRYIYQYATQLLTNNYHSDISEIENKPIILNIKTMFREKYIISLTDHFNLCGDGKHLSNKEKLIKIRNFIGIKPNACDEIPESGWNIYNLGTEGRSILR